MKKWKLGVVVSVVIVIAASADWRPTVADDYLRELQTKAIELGVSPVAHWGTDSQNYTAWGTHSNRLVPVYTFGTRGMGHGVDLTSYTGVNSLFRRESELRRIYGRVPQNTLNPTAVYCDQTNIYDIQRAAVAAGKKHIFLVIFDGLDWTTTRAATIYNLHRVAYNSGRGLGLHFLDDTAADTSQFGFLVTSPHNDGTTPDVNRQRLQNPGGKRPGGYNAQKGGPTPWASGRNLLYLIGKTPSGNAEHIYTDSAASATSMNAGAKTYNGSIGIDRTGNQLETIAHLVQKRGWSVGAVSSVPISHATPATAYAHNVSRNDYQDLTRDMLGLRSVSHPKKPLPGLDVLIGGGFGVEKKKDAKQGNNFVPGNRYLTQKDSETVRVENGGRYRVALRQKGVNGSRRLKEAAEKAANSGDRLLGVFGVGKYSGHLPFQTADGDYKPAKGRSRTAESYSQADINENPTVAEMTSAAIQVLSRNRDGFWLMVEAGDVDWAMHDNNLDNCIGAINSGDAAVKVISDWVSQHSNWQESLMIVTADHGHLLVLKRPDMLIPTADNNGQ